MLVFVEEGNWKTFKYHLRRDRWQSSGAMHPLPLAKIWGAKQPLPLNSGFQKDLNLFL